MSIKHLIVYSRPTKEIPQKQKNFAAASPKGSEDGNRISKPDKVDTVRFIVVPKAPHGEWKRRAADDLDRAIEEAKAVDFLVETTPGAMSSS